MLMITSSAGVFQFDMDQDKEPRLLWAREKGFWPFKKGSQGFFGICKHPDRPLVLAASRERLGTPEAGMKSTDCLIYTFNTQTQESLPPRKVFDVHNVHQICSDKENIYLTDTGKNRVVVYNWERDKNIKVFNIGSERADVNHLNALLLQDRHLLVGLNNRGHQDSQICRIPLEQALSRPEFEVNVDEFSERQSLLGRQHTHDIEPFGGDLLFSASHEGQVYRIGESDPVLKADDWVRGLCETDHGLWVGSSAIASRSQRHKEDLDGQVRLFSKKGFELLRVVHLRQAGQVNDIIEC